MNPVLVPIVTGGVRHGLTLLSGWIGYSAYLSGSEIDAAAAAVTALVGIGWSVASKLRAARAAG